MAKTRGCRNSDFRPITHVWHEHNTAWARDGTGRWQIELFCKWIKQHLRIKAFYGTSPNAVRTQVWSAIAVYLLVAILKKRLHLTSSPDTILQILSLTVFEKTPIQQALAQPTHTPASPPAQNPQCLLGF